MRERYVIVIETLGLIVLVSTLVYAIGVLSAGLLFLAVSLLVMAQVVKIR